MRKQERVRLIMQIAIGLMALAALVIAAVIISKKSCSNATNSSFAEDQEKVNITDISSLTTPGGDQTAAVTVIPSETPAATVNPSETPSPSAEPTANNTPTPTPAQSHTGQVSDPGLPQVPQGPYPSIPLVVTEGSFEDVKARLEQLKKLPASATIVLLDVGHGGFDGGTVGIDTKVTEADINLEIARCVAQWLGSKGYYVFMTRMGDYAVGSSKNADMKWRKSVMKLDIFDISISIHQNALETDRDVKGARIYCYKTGTPGEAFAKEMIAAISSEISTIRNNVYTGNLMVVREPICPSVLVECGFLSNHDEELLLQEPAYQHLLGKLIAKGAEAYLKSR